MKWISVDIISTRPISPGIYKAMFYVNYLYSLRTLVLILLLVIGFSVQEISGELSTNHIIYHFYCFYCRDMPFMSFIFQSAGRGRGLEAVMNCLKLLNDFNNTQ